MDAKLFRLPTAPNYYQPLQAAAPIDINELAKSQQLPAPNSRFPGWAGQMSDGRLVTNYDPNCESNIPAGRQFPTKEWMQKNADEILFMSRKRSAMITGAIYPLDSTVVPPPNMKAKCSPSGCEFTPTNVPGGIGLEREGADVPELFGTFQFPATSPPPATYIGLTQTFEGGRNSLRGRSGPNDYSGPPR